MILQFEVVVVAALTFALLLFRQPLVLVIELIASAIQEWVDPVVDQPSLAET